jgi:hypothetical protein
VSDFKRAVHRTAPACKKTEEEDKQKQSFVSRKHEKTREKRPGAASTGDFNKNFVVFRSQPRRID